MNIENKLCKKAKSPKIGKKIMSETNDYYESYELKRNYEYKLN